MSARITPLQGWIPAAPPHGIDLEALITIDACALLSKTLPTIQWVVPGVLAEGLVLLAGLITATVLASASEPERLRLACGRRAPPRIWTFLSILRDCRRMPGGGTRHVYFERERRSPLSAQRRRAPNLHRYRSGLPNG